MKILFADDQIPDQAIPDDKIMDVLQEAHPDWDIRFINAFPVMREAVETLQLAGYDVTVANTSQDALKLIEKKQFDLAIIDLGWFADNSLSEAQQKYYGWKLCEEIEKADKKRESKPTLQIIYSNRFAKKPDLSIHAADKGKLPLYKIYGKAGHEALKAAVKFIEWNLKQPSDDEVFFRNHLLKLRQEWLNLMKEPLKQQQNWFRLTLGSVAISLGLLFIGVLGALFWDFQIGLVTSISSILTGAISSLLFKQLQRKEEKVDTIQHAVSTKFEEAMKLYLSQTK